MYNPQIKTKVQQFIQCGGNFQELALEIYEDQVHRNIAYGRFSKGCRPQHWQDIPAVPVTLFRDLTFTCFPPFFAGHTFQTSGTTGPRGKHFLMDTEIYDLGALQGLHHIIGPIPKTGLSLVSSSADSSLGHMCRLFAPTMLQCFLPDYGVLVEESWQYLRNVQEAIFIPATAFAMAALLHNVSEPCILPEGSVMMITGGFKGRHIELSDHELRAKIEYIFPNTRIVGEYGMTELSSQLWSKNLDGAFIAPPWLKVMTVHPKTGAPVDGEGQLKFIDLANHQTVLAIETRDMGIVHPDGSMDLLGRLPSADARGCSLSVEEIDKHFLQQAAPHKNIANHKKWVPHQNPLKITQVLTALEILLQDEYLDQIAKIAEGLTSETAKMGWQNSIHSILKNAKAFETMLQNGLSPNQVSIVLAQGVFTAGLEWIALALASGGKVHVKAPSSAFQASEFIAEFLQEQGFEITCSHQRDIPDSDLLIAFGSDDSLQTVQKQVPHAIFQGYGHRFSVAYCQGRLEEAKKVALDIINYDGRGCMAPVGIFVCAKHIQDFAQYLYDELRAWQQIAPLGKVDPYLGPEYRRRIGLARQHAQPLIEEIHQESFGVLELPLQYFFPASLPRLITLYPIQDFSEMIDVLDSWKDQLSTLAIEEEYRSQLESSFTECFPRICQLGEMQCPIFGRNHDGMPMWPQHLPSNQ